MQRTTALVLRILLAAFVANVALIVSIALLDAKAGAMWSSISPNHVWVVALMLLYPSFITIPAATAGVLLGDRLAPVGRLPRAVVFGGLGTLIGGAFFYCGTLAGLAGSVRMSSAELTGDKRGLHLWQWLLIAAALLWCIWLAARALL